MPIPTMTHARLDGPLVMVGFGSIGKGTLPLILRHIEVARERMVIIDPDDSARAIAEFAGIRFEKVPLLPETLREILTPLLAQGGFLVNLSVGVSSVALIELCREFGALYLDTCIEPPPGGYTDPGKSISERSNYAMRESALVLRRPGADPTAVVAHGANPGMVSHLVKRALLHLARDLGRTAAPAAREDWGRLARELGVRGIHIAERDTQRARIPKQQDEFVNTWSIDGFLSEGLQPSELGWGTHETHMPPEGARHAFGCDAAIYLSRPGAGTRVRSWTPLAGPIQGFLITHNEAISIADYLTLRDGGRVTYRPTCHYAYHPCDDAILSLHELQGNAFRPQSALPADERGDRRWHRRTWRAALRPSEQRLLVWLAALDRGGASSGTVPERDRVAGDIGCAGRDGMGDREPAAGHRRGRRTRSRTHSGDHGALSGSDGGGLYRLDAAARPERAVPRRH